MSVDNPSLCHPVRDLEQASAKRPRIMNTPPAEADETFEEASLLSENSAKSKAGVLSVDEATIADSWERLLRQLRDEIDALTEVKADIIPLISFKDLRYLHSLPPPQNTHTLVIQEQTGLPSSPIPSTELRSPNPSVPSKAEPFLQSLRIKGAAIIRNVIPQDEATAWTKELDDYVRDNPHTQTSPPSDPDMYELFWSSAQLKARAHPNMLAAQQFAMGGCWSQARGRCSTRFSAVYADRLRMTREGSRQSSTETPTSVTPRAAVPGVESHDVARYEDSMGSRTHRAMTAGGWEDYDPWDSHARHQDTSSAFKMFSGLLPLSVGSPDGDPPIRLCLLPLKLTTAYQSLRPLFSPKRPQTGSMKEFLHPSNWGLDSTRDMPRSCEAQHIDNTPLPHLELEKTRIALPPLQPGDYVIWHPDTVHSVSASLPTAELQPPSPPSAQSSRRSSTPTSPKLTAALSIPCCPLTLNNATYLAHQRKAFILGFAPPDFTTGTTTPAGTGESCHLGRPGVQDISDAGGEAALCAMGLLAWDETRAVDEAERRLLERANAILFVDRG